MKTPKLEFIKDHAGEHRWRLTHGNGKILAASSEGFSRRAGAVKNFQRTRNALSQCVYEG